MFGAAAMSEILYFAVRNPVPHPCAPCSLYSAPGVTVASVLVTFSPVPAAMLTVRAVVGTLRTACKRYAYILTALSRGEPQAVSVVRILLLELRA